MDELYKILKEYASNQFYRLRLTSYGPRTKGMWFYTGGTFEQLDFASNGYRKDSISYGGELLDLDLLASEYDEGWYMCLELVPKEISKENDFYSLRQLWP